MSKKVKEVMSSNIAFVTTKDSIVKAAQLMNYYNIGSVPVLDKSFTILGMLTDRDIVIRSVALGGDLSNIQIGQIMTTNIVTATPDMTLDQAGELMAANKIRRLPVIEHDTVVGIVSLGDIALVSEYTDVVGKALMKISKK